MTTIGWNGNQKVSLKTLRKYLERCPLQTFDKKGLEANQQFQLRKDKLLMEREYQKDKICVYCGSKEHRTNDCTKVLTLADSREHLKSNKLCFNCTGKKDNAASCRSRRCLKCGEKYLREKDQLPMLMILGAADYQRIRSAEPPVLGKNPDTDPGAEYTVFDWILYVKSISTEEDIDRGFLAKSGQEDFEKLCSLDVLGLIYNADKSNIEFHTDFKKQLQLKEDGFYKTRLPWKPNRPDLPMNKEIAIS